jgi:hypothetical protein
VADNENKGKTGSDTPKDERFEDNVGDRHDDGLWPDYEISTESVRDQNEVAEARSGRKGSSKHDTKVTEPKQSPNDSGVVRDK